MSISCSTANSECKFDLNIHILHILHILHIENILHITKHILHILDFDALISD